MATTSNEAQALSPFALQLLQDLAALARMLEDGLIERGVRRLGAEQELFLVEPVATRRRWLSRCWRATGIRIWYPN